MIFADFCSIFPKKKQILLKVYKEGLKCPLPHTVMIFYGLIIFDLMKIS